MSEGSQQDERRGWTPGVRLAVDWGGARIGVAACDRDGVLCYPVETVSAGPAAFDRLAGLVDEYEPVAVIVGLPTTLAGTEGLAAAKIRAHADTLAARIHPIPVCLSDERLTTAGAARRLSAAGRSAKQQRRVIDQAAAVAILEHALDLLRGDTVLETVVPATEPGRKDDS